MFRYSTLIVGTVAILLAWSGQLHAQTQDERPEREPPTPLELAQRCAKKVNAARSRCIEANAKVVRRCVPQIKELLEAGRDDAAAQLARRCVTTIREQTTACHRNITELCKECVQKLLRLEEEQLAKRLRNHCDKTLTAVQKSGRRASNAITQLF